MMDDAAAISGTFADLRFVRSRKVCQLVIELPLEQADAALAALGGVPRPDAEVWVAVARLAKPGNAPVAAGKPERSPDAKRWNSLAPAQQAGIRCADPVFQRFIADEHDGSGDEDSTIEAVRHFCRVHSRSDIQPGTKAGEAWQRLDNEFLAWRYA